MARSLNKAFIIGNVGRDPEMRYTPQGSAVTTFSVAVNRTLFSRDGEAPRDETEWFRVTAWGKLAETCNQYLAKGQQVCIEGSVHLNSWEGNDGQKHAALALTATDMLMLGSKRREDTERAEDDFGSDAEPDDIPF